jgi:periplasmic protein TonB
MSRTSAVASDERIDPCSLRGLSLGHRPRGARSSAVLISVAFHVGALLLFAANLNVAHKPKPALAPEREPILVRLPRALSLPAPPKAAEKAPEKKPTPPKVRPREEIVQPVPQVIPPEPEEVPAEPEGEPSEEIAEAPAAAPPTESGKTGGVAGGIGDGPLELREVARAPTLIERVTPEYPRQARTDHIEGLVLLRAVIGRDGRVERDQIRVVRSVPVLDGAAVSALCGWRFTPAVDHQGQTVRVVVEIPFEFTLS